MEEWEILPFIVGRLFRIWGLPQIDLFTSARNAVRPLFFSITRGDAQTQGRNALHQKWQMYTFPPRSPTQSDSAEYRQTVGVDWRIDPDHASMERCLMVGGGHRPFDHPPSSPPYPRSETAVVSGSLPTPFNGLAIMHERVSSTGISNPLAEFISNSIRGSTQCTYEPAWQSWRDWCRSCAVDPVLSSETNLAEYLWFLFSDRHLAPASTIVHRSAICSFLDLLGSSGCDSKVISWLMHAAFLNKPAARAFPRSTWDVAKVLESLRSWGAIDSLSFAQLSWRTFALILIFSCRRVADLAFLSIDDPFMVLHEELVSFQLCFGLKESRPSHRYPAIQLLLALEESLCPVCHVHAYLVFTAPLRSSRSFFITTMPPHGAAARGTLCQWFACILRGAGIEASPGSARTEVASTALARAPA